MNVECARGLMEGIAVGNLLGIRMEGWSRQRIADAYPDGVREIVAGSGYPDDDDLAQAIIVAEAALGGPLHTHTLALDFWLWGEANGLGMGGLTRDVLALFGGGAPQRLAAKRSAGEVRPPDGRMSIEEASRRAWGGGRAGNGALMRCWPLAIRWCGHDERLVAESVESAVVTHWDIRCGWSCALANLAAAGALRDQRFTADELLCSAENGMEAAMPYVEQYGYRPQPPRSVVEAVQRAWRSDLEDIAFDGADRGYTLLTLQAALISFWCAESFESGLARVIEAGGDTDTNGAAAGAVLGARFGRRGIPGRWRKRVFEIRLGRIPMQWYADRLIDALGQSGKFRWDRRVWDLVYRHSAEWSQALYGDFDEDCGSTHEAHENTDDLPPEYHLPPMDLSKIPSKEKLDKILAAARKRRDEWSEGEELLETPPDDHPDFEEDENAAITHQFAMVEEYQRNVRRARESGTETAT